MSRIQRAEQPDVNVWEPCHIDDIVCVLDPVQAASLEWALTSLPASRRIQVAMAVAGLKELGELVAAIGMGPKQSHSNSPCYMNMRRWVSGQNRMPMGIGFRLGRVFGVSAEVLCEGYI